MTTEKKKKIRLVYKCIFCFLELFPMNNKQQKREREKKERTNETKDRNNTKHAFQVYVCMCVVSWF